VPIAEIDLGRNAWARSPCLRLPAPSRRAPGRIDSRPANKRNAPISRAAGFRGSPRPGLAAARGAAPQARRRCPPPLGGGRHTGAVERGGSLGRPGEAENLGEAQNIRYQKGQEYEKPDHQRGLEPDPCCGKRIERARSVRLRHAQGADAAFRVVGHSRAPLQAGPDVGPVKNEPRSSRESWRLQGGFGPGPLQPARPARPESAHPRCTG